MRGRHIRDENESLHWASFKYEKIMTICHICGKVTHKTNFCDQPWKGGELHPFGEELLAESPSRRELRVQDTNLGRRSYSQGLSQDHIHLETDLRS
ncbi:hypothetical protein Syun_012683 [Stephania yunnanensis]|uniref:Zinc knuckle CX2CX4HX4C domain-containing protein n=1 Tax=Stephania yunnanensis TaxID=152371 RepID=A0AAP0K192_9MAGN